MKREIARKGEVPIMSNDFCIGNVGKKENGIVAVTAYGLVAGMILPLCFEVYKPRERLKAEDEYYSKPQIAATISLYGESKLNARQCPRRVEVALYPGNSQQSCLVATPRPTGVPGAVAEI